MKNQLAIRFVNEMGVVEDGIDGGGLFKEFITKLCENIFNPDACYFKENEQDRKLMP
jgi:ubiquitin-protein ligase E3 C